MSNRNAVEVHVFNKENAKDACICQRCGHNMKRSRVKNGSVRCNACKTWYTVMILEPKKK